MDFDNIIGNSLIKTKLKNAIVQNKLSNTLLFAGPEGIGKSCFAKALACILMHPENDPDPKALQKIENNNHPDLHIYEVEGKTSKHSIASIRELIDQVFITPFEAEAKVFVIQDAERMLPTSANALLKTLEEPTLDSYIILLSNKADDILPTILSRCFRLNFSAISEKEIASFLLKKESKDEKEVNAIAKIANGSIGKAIELFEHPDYIKKRNYFLNILAKENISSYVELSDALIKLDEIYSQDSFAQDDKSNIKLQKEIDLLLEKLMYWFRDLHILKINGDEKHLFFSDKINLLKKQNLNKIPSLAKVLGLLEEVKLGLNRNIKLKVVLENFFLKINFV